MLEAKLVLDGDFVGIEDQSESLLLLTGIDYLTTDHVIRTLQTAHRKLRSGGQIEFTVFDFGRAARTYLAGGLTEGLVISLTNGGQGRRSIWDELHIARTLLYNGYYKVWTGLIEGRPALELTVKAMKFES